LAEDLAPHGDDPSGYDANDNVDGQSVVHGNEVASAVAKRRAELAFLGQKTRFFRFFGTNLTHVPT
jgi:hypothetical protein